MTTNHDGAGRYTDPRFPQTSLVWEGTYYEIKDDRQPQWQEGARIDVFSASEAPEVSEALAHAVAQEIFDGLIPKPHQLKHLELKEAPYHDDNLDTVCPECLCCSAWKRPGCDCPACRCASGKASGLAPLSESEKKKQLLARAQQRLDRRGE